MSLKATNRALRLTIAAGISPAAILQKTQSLMSDAQRSFDLLPEDLGGVFRWWTPLVLRELLEQFLLLGGELGRRPHVHAHVQIAAPALAQPRQPLAAHAVDRAGLRPLLDAERRGPVRRRDLHLGAERGLAERDGEGEDEVIAVALEARVFGDLQDGDEVAPWTVARAGHALAPHGEVMVVGDARRHVDAQRLLGFDAPIPAARRARIGDDGPLPRARGARRDGEQLAEQRLRLAAHLAGAAAGAARPRLRPRLGAAAAARRARLESADADRLRGAGGDLVQGEPQRHLQVGPTPLVALRSLAAPEQRIEAAQVPEIAHEDAERFGKVEVREAEARAPAAQAGFAVAVVGGP